MIEVIDKEEARYLAGQAADVLEMAAANDTDSGALWGLQYLAELVALQFGDALDTKDIDKHQTASDTASGLIALMDALDAEKHGSGVFYGAQSLVRAAKLSLDKQLAALNEAEPGPVGTAELQDRQ